MRRRHHVADRLSQFLELSDTIPEFKRRTFITANSVATLLTLGYLMSEPFVASRWFPISLQVTIILYASTMTWLLWRSRDHQELIVFGCVIGAEFFVLAIMAYDLYPKLVLPASPDLLRTVSPWLTWLAVLQMAGFLTFRPRTALQVTLTLSVVFFLILLVSVAARGAWQMVNLLDVMQIFCVNIIVIFLTYPLASAQEQAAHTDFLTGLANRNSGYDVLTREVARAQRYGLSFSIILFDLDKFKQINDTYGHPRGDVALREVGALARMHVRQNDLLCRWGGEEFLLLLAETSLRMATHKAEELRCRMNSYSFSCGFALTASFGVAEFHPNDTAETLLDRVDRALYRAKNAGRNSTLLEENVFESCLYGS